MFTKNAAKAGTILNQQYAMAFLAFLYKKIFFKLLIGTTILKKGFFL